MKLVINISKEDYERLKEYEKAPFNSLTSRVYEAIANGTPLPKGHGRLVDISEVLIKLMQFYDGDKTIGQCLDEVNTIIEAEGSNKE